MLTPEKINTFNALIANNQAPAPEDAADFEIYKAMRFSNAMAGQEATVTPSVAPVQTPAVAMPVVAPAPVPVAVKEADPITVFAPANGNSYSMDDLMSNTMLADKYIKVKNQQTFIGDDLVGNKELYVTLNFADIRAKQTIKGGNPVKYRSTIDGRTCIDTGDSWMNAVIEIKRLAPDAKPYNCVDLTFTLLRDATSYDGSVVAPAGTRLGHTTATTNWKKWVEFYRSLPNHEGEVIVRLTREDVQKETNKWALVNFEYVSNAEAASLGLITVA